MDLLSTIRTNGAARDYTDEAVDDATIYRILDTARFAPSGGNRQAWTVLVVKDAERRRQLRDLSRLGWREYVAHQVAGHTPFSAGADGRYVGPPIDLDEAAMTPTPAAFVDRLDEAPALLVLCADLTRVAMFDILLDRPGFVGGASIYPFAQNILLAARAEGLAGVLTTFAVRREPAVKALLRIPAGQAVAGIIALGHPVKQFTKLTRRPVEDFARIDTFDGPALEAP